MAHNLLAIDQGTTSSRAIVFSPAGDILALAQKELTLHYPHKGWVEQNPDDIWSDTLWACEDVLCREGDIAAIGITNQRETTILWERSTGKAIYNAIVWQDRRTAQHCSALKEARHEQMIAAKTGLLLDPYFSATKIAWILDNVDGARQKAEAGELAFGTVDSFLLWHLTGGQVHATDVTNASRTLLYNIVSQDWDEDLLGLFKIPRSLLPEVKDNSANYGQTKAGVLPVSLIIGGIAGDQQAALIGQGCFEHGMVKSTYGTGCFALMNVGSDFKQSENRLLTTAGYRLDGKMTYALEGSIFIAGAAVQWLRDNMNFFDDAKESEALARSVDDHNGVYFVPAFTGLGAPYWNPEARGLIMGLGRESTKAHITRAALEAQAYQTKDLMAAMQADSGVKPAVIRADGGLVGNEFVCQFLADMLDIPLERPQITEATAWGAACLAGLQVGVFSSLEDISARWKLDKRYEPSMDPQERETLYKGWSDAVNLIA
ncbi:MAG: glycerol kinase GlpK [Alphaproteobacteria bacterium]|nr:glycerol kinase GlpK [Alphaproteobacteria bacterium]